MILSKLEIQPKRARSPLHLDGHCPISWRYYVFLQLNIAHREEVEPALILPSIVWVVAISQVRKDGINTDLPMLFHKNKILKPRAKTSG
jgi:hypothetical protein